MKSKIIILLILISSVLLANFHVNKNNLKTPDINNSFPLKINNMTGTDYKASKGVYEMIPADKMLLRIYQSKITGYKSTLAIVLTDKREHIHDPDICYREQGFSFGKRQVIELSKNRQITYVPAFKEKQKVDIYYWYTDLITTYSYKKEFLERVSFARFFDKPFKGYGLIILISPAEYHKESVEFIKTIDSILTKI